MKTTAAYIHVTSGIEYIMLGLPYRANFPANRPNQQGNNDGVEESKLQYIDDSSSMIDFASTSKRETEYTW